MRHIGVGLLVIAALASFKPSWAQNTDRIRLDAVEVQGLERVSESLVRSKIEIQAGDVLDPRAVARDIRRLYGLGFFTTIRADIDTATQNVLTYVLQEEQFIDELRIVGNKKIKSRQIRGVLSWREGDAFVREGYHEERDAVLDFYRSKGFLNTTVDIVVEPVAPSQVRVTYILDEGKKAKIHGIKLIGNEALGDRKLHRVIKTRRAFWFLGGRYDDAKWEADLASVVNAYADVGRLEADVAATEFDYTKKGKRLTISLFLNEGPEYTVDTIGFSDNFAYADNELIPLSKLGSGDVHNRSQVTADAQAMQRLYRNVGYVNARVAPQVTLDGEHKTTSVLFRIDERELKYVREIRITGNDVTKDEVVRRNILLKPGERFDGNLLDASSQRLDSTGFFEGSRLRLEDIPENDRYTNVLVDVDEGKTGNFNFGGAFNTDSGFGGFGELSLNNFDITNWPSFSGGGQRLTSRFFLGTSRTNIRIGFTDPAIFGYPLSLGVDVFSERFQGTGASNFTTDTKGAQVRLAKRLSTHNSASVALSFRDTSITDLDTFVSPELRELEDPGSTLSVILGLNRNTANDFRNPTRGGDHNASLEIANFGLDNDFVSLGHDSIWYYGLKRWQKISFSLRTRENVALPFGSKEFIPISDRFFAGGSSTLRGYDFRNVGPKALTFRTLNGNVLIDQEPIGGELRVLNTLEAKYLLSDLIRLYTFADSGALFLKPEDFRFNDFRFSVGVGVGIDVPLLGPLRLDYGYPLNPDEDQGSGQIHLQSSLRF